MWIFMVRMVKFIPSKSCNVVVGLLVQILGTLTVNSNGGLCTVIITIEIAIVIIVAILVVVGPAAAVRALPQRGPLFSDAPHNQAVSGVRSARVVSSEWRGGIWDTAHFSSVT